MNTTHNANAHFLRECARRMLKLADELDCDELAIQAIPKPSAGLLEAAWATQTVPTEAELLERATIEYRSRQQRCRHLPQELFGEPAWDMLVDLFIAALQRRDISVSSACLASGVPTTTALRWLGQVERMGLVERRASHHDHRVVLVRLSKKGFQAMTDYYSKSGRKMVPSAVMADE